jgi:hypothetical protein
MVNRPIRLTPIGGLLLCIGFTAGAIFGFAGSYRYAFGIEKATIGIRTDLEASRLNERAEQAILRDLLERQYNDGLRIEKLEKQVSQLR